MLRPPRSKADSCAFLPHWKHKSPHKDKMTRECCPWVNSMEWRACGWRPLHGSCLARKPLEAARIQCTAKYTQLRLRSNVASYRAQYHTHLLTLKMLSNRRRNQNQTMAVPRWRLSWHIASVKVSTAEIRETLLNKLSGTNEIVMQNNNLSYRTQTCIT